MSLDNLNKKVNNPDELIDNSEVYGEKKLPAENKFIAGDGKWKRTGGWLDEGTLKIIKITAMIFAGFFVLAAIAYGVFRYSQTAFSEERVLVEIEGSADINSSELVKYKIKYRNDNRAELENAELVISYPENFKPEGNSNFQTQGESNSVVNVGKIKSHGEGYAEISGRFYAPVDYTLLMKASLKYTPSNFNSQFQSGTQKGLSVKTSPVAISISAPMEILSESKISYVIGYQNTSSISFDDLKLEVGFPKGFEIQNSEVSIFKENSVWNVGRLEAGQKGEIKIEGIIQGVRGDVKSINVTIGQFRQDKELLVFDKREAVSKIVALPLSISQTINEQKSLNINPGENLNYRLNYRNDGDVGLRDLIITMKIDSPVLDFSKLNLSGGGSYDAEKKEITWKAADVSQLAKLDPGQGGSVSFSIPVKDKIEIKGKEDKNFSIESIAKIDSPDVAYPAIGVNESASRALVKVNSKIILETTGYYKDANIATSGPIPPEVGKETEYIIHWSITNISNDIDDVSVSAFLPTGVKWKNEIYSKSEDVKYNERTNEIVWNPGKIENGTGILGEVRSVSFKVSIVPQINQEGKTVVLLGKTTLRAKDLFTGEEVSKETAEKNTELREDSSITSAGYQVKKGE